MCDRYFWQLGKGPYADWKRDPVLIGKGPIERGMGPFQGPSLWRKKNAVVWVKEFWKRPGDPLWRPVSHIFWGPKGGNLHFYIYLIHDLFKCYFGVKWVPKFHYKDVFLTISNIFAIFFMISDSDKNVNEARSRVFDENKWWKASYMGYIKYF